MSEPLLASGGSLGLYMRFKFSVEFEMIDVNADVWNDLIKYVSNFFSVIGVSFIVIGTLRPLLNKGELEISSIFTIWMAVGLYMWVIGAAIILLQVRKDA